MSVQAMAWVLETEATTKGSERLVLLALANHVSQERIDGPWEAWPGIDRLAREAGVNRKTARTALRRLQDRGLVSVAVQAAPDSRIRPDRRTNLYTIHPNADGPDRAPKPDGGARHAPPHGGVNHTPRGGKPRPHGGVNHARTGGSYAPPKPVEEPVVEPGLNQACMFDAPELFDEFWSVYPRRVAKAEARRAWDKAIKATAPSVILDGATRYAAETRGRELVHIAHPATWIRGCRWDDEPGANAARPVRGAAAPVSARRDGPEGRVTV